ncbi:MAG TPA: hypothetical protein DDW49_01685 [Deltaproteobacteria bacterium]|nr:hypothetical protein [Deltaproteobacteria bacterium]
MQSLFHRRGTEFAEFGIFLIKNSLLRALRVSAASALKITPIASGIFQAGRIHRTMKIMWRRKMGTWQRAPTPFRRLFVSFKVGACCRFSREKRARQAAPLRNVTPTPCIDCNVCMEACPQYGNSDYVGPKVLYQMAEGLKQGLETRLATSVIKSLMNEGGVDDCQNAQNCVQVCPQKLPLTESIAYLKREVAIQAFKELFR